MCTRERKRPSLPTRVNNYAPSVNWDSVYTCVFSLPLNIRVWSGCASVPRMSLPIVVTACVFRVCARVRVVWPSKCPYAIRKLIQLLTRVYICDFARWKSKVSSRLNVNNRTKQDTKRTKSKNEEWSTYNIIRRKKRIRIKEEIYKTRHPRQTIGSFSPDKRRNRSNNDRSPPLAFTRASSMFVEASLARPKIISVQSTWDASHIDRASLWNDSTTIAERSMHYREIENIRSVEELVLSMH